MSGRPQPGKNMEIKYVTEWVKIVMMKYKYLILGSGILTCWYSSIAPHSRACFSSNVKSEANLNFPVHDKDLYVSVSVRISAHVLWRSLIWSLRERSVNPEENTLTLRAHKHTSPFT